MTCRECPCPHYAVAWRERNADGFERRVVRCGLCGAVLEATEWNRV